ncbi:unnamed protein product [Trichobilharzia szidati]|nr:unnamed protein product [Trichobilharzia szidati]
MGVFLLFNFVQSLVDWFHEFYKLSSYVRLDRFPNSQIRSAELIIEHRTDEHMISSHSSNVPMCNRICSNNTLEKQQTAQFTCPTISAMPMDLGHSICATHSFPSFTDVSNFDWTTRQNSILCKMHHDNSSANETLDHSNKTEVSKTKKWRSGKSQLSINTKKKKHEENGKKLGDDGGGDDEDDDEDESSIDSDDEESMENCINIFPPGIDILRISTDSDLSPSKLRRSIDHNGESKGCSTSYSYLMSTSKRQKRKPPIAVGQLTKSKLDSEQIYSNSLSLSQTTTNTSLRNLYEDYLRTDFTKQPERIDKYHEYDLTSPNPLSSISVDKDSLEVYTEKKYIFTLIRDELSSLKMPYSDCTKLNNKKTPMVKMH